MFEKKRSVLSSTCTIHYCWKFWNEIDFWIQYPLIIGNLHQSRMSYFQNIFGSISLMITLNISGFFVLDKASILRNSSNWERDLRKCFYKSGCYSHLGNEYFVIIFSSLIFQKNFLPQAEPSFKQINLCANQPTA